jgi:hypothetical protein
MGKRSLPLFSMSQKLLQTIFGLSIALGKHRHMNTHTPESFIDGVESMLTLDEAS